MLRRVADEGGDLAQHALAQLVRRQVRVRLGELAEPVLAEAVIARVHRLADAVGEEHEQIAVVQQDRVLLQQPLERLALVDLQSQHESVGREDLRPARFEDRSRDVDQRRVAGARIRHRTRSQIEDRVGHRDEAARVEMLRDDAVRVDQEVPRRRVDAAQRQHEPLELRHVQRSRRPFARDVGDQHAEPVIVEREKIVVVTAHFSRRDAHRRDRQARHPQRALRQQRHLDFMRDAKLLFEPLLLRGLAQQIFDARGHLVERPRQLAELIFRSHRNLVREIALSHALGAPEQLVHRSGDRFGEGEAGQRGNHFDDEEQRADDEQHHQQSLAERSRHAALGRRDPVVEIRNAERGRDGENSRLAAPPIAVLHEARHIAQHALRRERRPIAFVSALTATERLCISGDAARRDASYFDARVVLQPLPHLIVDQQVDDDRVARMRSVGKADGAHDEVRVLVRGLGGLAMRVREHAREPGAWNPSGNRARWIDVPPRSGGDHRRIGQRLDIRRTGAAAIGRHDRHRQLRELLGLRRLPARDDARHVASAGALDFERGALRDETRAIGQRVEAALHEVRAEVVEQQEPAQQEERHDEQRRHEADEDVRQNHLAAHAPQQPPLREHDEPEREVRGARRDREAGDGVDDAQKRRHAAGDRADEPHDELDRGADDDRAAGQRVE